MMTVETILVASLALGVFLQALPPLIRVYLRNPETSRGKVFLFGVAFIALYVRIFARQSVRTDEGVLLTGSLRTNTLLKCVYLTGCYEPSLAAYLKSKVKPGDVFLDIGANVGHFSLLAASIGADVISVEASSVNCKLFSKNVTANALGSKIRLIHSAAGERDGIIELRENRFNSMCSTISRSAFGYLRLFTRKTAVPLARVDDLLSEDDVKRIRFVKIDVEGAELEVVRGLTRLISSGRPDLELCVELSPSWMTAEQANEVFSIFREHGYTSARLFNQERDFPPYSIAAPQPFTEEFEEQVDLIFSRGAG